MMTDLSALVVVIILMNCYPESEIFVLRRKYFGEKCLKYKILRPKVVFWGTAFGLSFLVGGNLTKGRKW